MDTMIGAASQLVFAMKLVLCTSSCRHPVIGVSTVANPNKSQGTTWESTIESELLGMGRRARRRALTATKDEPDVEVDGAEETLPVLAVKHYYPSKGGKNRRSIEYFAVPRDAFMKLYELDQGERFALAIQCKAREQISVRRMLQGIVDWVAKHT